MREKFNRFGDDKIYGRQLYDNKQSSKKSMGKANQENWNIKSLNRYLVSIRATEVWESSGATVS